MRTDFSLFPTVDKRMKMPTQLQLISIQRQILSIALLVMPHTEAPISVSALSRWVLWEVELVGVDNKAKSDQMDPRR